MMLVLLMLTDSSQVSAYSYKQFRSFCRLLASSARSTKSSAQSKWLTSKPASEGVRISSSDESRTESSWMYILNSSGDIGWPCSVPIVTSMVVESFCTSLMRVLEFCYMCLTHLKKLPSMPIVLSLYSRASLHTVSNALR